MLGNSAIILPFNMSHPIDATISQVASSQEVGSTAALISVGIFLVVFASISLQLLHETAAALLGAVAVFLVTYIGGKFHSSLSILTFEEAMRFVDWNVIFLIMGMMIFMAILAETNVFKWLAFRLYRASRGNTWLLAAALITLTGITSAFLNDVTAILLIVPLSIQIAVAIDLNPFAIIIPEVLASNIGGAATLIGDPPSTIVGSHIGLSFGEYLVHMAPIAIICMIALIIFNRLQYGKEYEGAKTKISPTLLNKLELESEIVNHATLHKALWIGALTFILFFTADLLGGIPPSVVALTGATLLILWVRPDMHHMLREVDWTTLIFFIGLFVVVGGLEATGAIGWLASRIQILAGESVNIATMMTTWISGIVSAIVANIPFTVAALPIADVLSASLPNAATSRVIYWALILGADLGGNATYLGSAPNIVAVGLLAQAGFRLSFGRFARDGVPVTILTLALASLWLLLRY